MTTAGVMMETTVARTTVMVTMVAAVMTPAHHPLQQMIFKTPSMTAKIQDPATRIASNRQRFARPG
jgi:hypothetical protein